MLQREFCNKYPLIHAISRDSAIYFAGVTIHLFYSFIDSILNRLLMGTAIVFYNKKHIFLTKGDRKWNAMSTEWCNVSLHGKKHLRTSCQYFAFLFLVQCLFWKLLIRTSDDNGLLVCMSKIYKCRYVN